MNFFRRPGVSSAGDDCYGDAGGSVWKFFKFKVSQQTADKLTMKCVINMLLKNSQWTAI